MFRKYGFVFAVAIILAVFSFAISRVSANRLLQDATPTNAPPEGPTATPTPTPRPSLPTWTQIPSPTPGGTATQYAPYP